MPEAAKKAAMTGADGVGLLRTEHMMLTTGVHPKKFIIEGREDELIKLLVENILRWRMLSTLKQYGIGL